MVLFIKLCKVVLTFESVDEILKCNLFEMKSIEHYFLVVLFVFLNILCTNICRVFIQFGGWPIFRMRKLMKGAVQRNTKLDCFFSTDGRHYKSVETCLQKALLLKQ